MENKPDKTFGQNTPFQEEKNSDISCDNGNGVPESWLMDIRILLKKAFPSEYKEDENGNVILIGKVFDNPLG